MRDIIEKLEQCDYKCGAGPLNVSSDWRELKDEIERLEGVVDTLPRTADGVPVVPGMTVWCVNQFDEIDEVGIEMSFHGDPLLDIGAAMCYSTREAAEAAKEN